MSQVKEIFLIGEDFTVGNLGNAEIDILLGFDTTICGEFSIRKDDGYTHSPDYCESLFLTSNELEKIKVYPVILPASHRSAKRRARLSPESAKELEDKFVAVFTIGGEIYVTRPYDSDSHAQACVLWYVLAYLKL